MMHCWKWLYVYACALAICLAFPLAHAQINSIGREVAIPQHLQNGQEFQMSLSTLLEFGRQLFTANWTIQEGQGRPFAKGVGTPTGLSDPTSPLVFPRNFNRLSAPDANSCSGCHNVPIAGGAGDIVANVFVLGQRFDSITMDRADGIMTRGAVDDLVPAGRIFNVASVLHTYWPLTPRAPRYAVILGIVFVLRLSRAYARRRHSTARTLQAVG